VRRSVLGGKVQKNRKEQSNCNTQRCSGKGGGKCEKGGIPGEKREYEVMESKKGGIRGYPAGKLDIFIWGQIRFSHRKEC